MKHSKPRCSSKSGFSVETDKRYTLCTCRLRKLVDGVQPYNVVKIFQSDVSRNSNFDILFSQFRADQTPCKEFLNIRTLEGKAEEFDHLKYRILLSSWESITKFAKMSPNPRILGSNLDFSLFN